MRAAAVSFLIKESSKETRKLVTFIFKGHKTCRWIFPNTELDIIVVLNIEYFKLQSRTEILC